MSIAEGLICPECMTKFVTLKALQGHFQQIHVEQIRIPDESNGFLGIIKKAKKSFEDILEIKANDLNYQNELQHNVYKVAECETVDTDTIVSYAFYEEPNIKPQPKGIFVNKTEDFIQMRRSKLLHSAIEMSSLILKIEKIISFQSNGNNNCKDRKNFEQSLVEWVKDDLVPMCPSCGGRFGINSPINTYSDNPVSLSTEDDKSKVRKLSRLKNAFITFLDMEIESSGLLIRKKHHCRLCGCIICAHCSYMLGQSEAVKLVNAINSRFELKESLLEESKGLLWKHDSQNSLDSIKSKIKSSPDYSIRCCGNCKSQIEAKWSQMERRICDMEIVDLYQELIERINKVTDILPEYNTMCQSLCLGETDYSYHRTNELRSDIVKLCQEIDAIGNKFKLKTPVNGNEREANLFQAIYRNSFLFLQNNFATLKQLPKEDKLEEIVKRRLMSIRKKAESERIIQKNRSPELIKYVVKSDNHNSGWAPTIPNSIHSTEFHKSTNPFECDTEDSTNEEIIRLDALALQMENVRQYIEMARQANKMQEVKMLESNMLDLKLEYETLQKKIKFK